MLFSFVYVLVGFVVGLLIGRNEYRGQAIPWRALENGRHFTILAWVSLGTTQRLLLQEGSSAEEVFSVDASGGDPLQFCVGTRVVKTQEGFKMLK